MRNLLLATAMVTLTLAGCLDDSSDSTPDPVDNTGKAWFDAAHQYDLRQSHPAYSYPVSSALPFVGEPGPGLPDDWRQPVPSPVPETITGLVHEGQVIGVGSGAGIGLLGTTIIAGTWGGLGVPGPAETPADDGAFVVADITNPKETTVTAVLPELVSADTDLIAFPDGRMIAVSSTRGANILVVNVTDKHNPELLSIIETVNGNHNHATVPGTPLVYNTGSDGAGGSTEIWDLSDPSNPILVQDWENGYGCHAASFFIDREQDKYRGYCAGIQMTQIWDITDPLNPSVIIDIPWPGLGDSTGTVGSINTLSFSHLAMTNHDGTVLIAGDESGGGAAPACDAYVEAPVTGNTATGPLGNLWFYDISDEMNPVLHGSYSPAAWEQRGSCTAHFGGIIEDTNHLVMAFYTAGVALIDFNDLDNPRAVDLWQRTEAEQICTFCGVWDAQYYNGYVFTGDIDRGMDIFTIG